MQYGHTAMLACPGHESSHSVWLTTNAASCDKVWPFHTPSLLFCASAQARHAERRRPFISQRQARYRSGTRFAGLTSTDGAAAKFRISSHRIDRVARHNTSMAWSLGRPVANSPARDNCTTAAYCKKLETSWYLDTFFEIPSVPDIRIQNQNNSSVDT
jgi:hypothetical protein